LTLPRISPSPPTTSPALHTLSLHDALPIYSATRSTVSVTTAARSRPQSPCNTRHRACPRRLPRSRAGCERQAVSTSSIPGPSSRSEEHTSELQSRFDLVCRLLLAKQK